MAWQTVCTSMWLELSSGHGASAVHMASWVSGKPWDDNQFFAAVVGSKPDGLFGKYGFSLM